MLATDVPVSTVIGVASTKKELERLFREGAVVDAVRFVSIVEGLPASTRIISHTYFNESLALPKAMFLDEMADEFMVFLEKEARLPKTPPGSQGREKAWTVKSAMIDNVSVLILIAGWLNDFVAH